MQLILRAWSDEMSLTASLGYEIVLELITLRYEGSSFK